MTTFLESVTSKMQNLWRSFFYSKCLKISLDFKNAAKNWQKAFSFSDNWIRIGVVKLSLWRTRYFPSAANVLTSSPKILHVNFACQERLFPTKILWQWSINMIKVLWCRFQQCLGTFTMLLVEGSSKAEIFRDSSSYVFGVRNFGTTNTVRVIFFFKIFKIYSRFKKCSKKLRKIFIS